MLTQPCNSLPSGQHIIVTDMTSAFCQIPLAKESIIRSTAVLLLLFKEYESTFVPLFASLESALQEVTCHVLGPLPQDGSMAKIADDLYCGGENTSRAIL